MAANTILIVEDDGILCINMEDMLTAEGYEVMGVLPSGEKALELVKERQPDLIIMDINLAGELDGISTVEQIKTIADIPVIYLTAYTEDILIRRATETAPYAFLVKPVQERELIATIEMALHRHKAEEALKASEARFRDLANNTPDYIYSLDREKRHTAVNLSVCAALGLTDRDIIGKNHQELGFPEDICREWHQLHHQVFSTKQVVKSETSAPMPDGTVHTYEVVLTPVFGEGGDVTGIRGISRDITERKQAEQKLADYTLELEQLYHQLDEEINKARLVHERILPTKLPDIPGISFAPHYQPAQKMGGDFYDIIQKDNKLTFYLSDVSGHGLDGAMLSVFVKYTIKSYISITPADELSPAAILHHLAEQFDMEDYPEDLYVCLFMAVMDLTSMELNYCNAGLQEALLVQLGSGKRQKLHSKGMFITSYLPLEILKLQENSITLTPGSTIFCNTDGLTEQGSGGTYYRDKLLDVFFQNAHLPAHQVAQSVLEDFRKFNNGSLQGRDDITFLVLQIDDIE